MLETYTIDVHTGTSAPIMRPAGMEVHRDRSKSFSAVAAGVRAALGGAAPGGWATDHRGETEQFKGWHYIAIHAIAKQAAQATVTVYDDSQIGDSIAKSVRGELRRHFGSRWKAVASAQNEKAATPVPDTHRLARLYRRPSPYQSGAAFRYEIAQQLGLTGTCLIWKVPNQLGGTCERYVIPTCVAEPVRPSRSLPRGGYRINPAAARSWALQRDPSGFVEVSGFFRAVGATLPMEQIITTRWPHPLFKDDGQSSVAAGALWTDTASMLDTARWSQLHNGPNPSLAIIGPDDADLSPAELMALAIQFNAKYAGAKNHGKAAFFNHGTSAVPLTTTPREMAYELGFPQYRDAIMGLHGTPPSAAGITESTSFAALYASLLQFVTLTVQPMLSLHAEEETVQQAVEFGEHYTVEIEATGLDDPQILENQLRNDMAVGLRTIDEVRALRGLPPAPGPWGQERAMAGGDPLAGAGGGMGMPGDSSMVAAGNRGNLQGAPSAPGGSFRDATRMQWIRKERATDEVVAKYREGGLTQTAAEVRLTSLGWSADEAKRLLDDDAGNDPTGGDTAGSDAFAGINGKTIDKLHDDWLERAIATALME